MSAPEPQPAGTTQTPASALRWRKILPGEEREIRQVRRWLADLLPECPARDDVITIAVELCTNAVKFTGSGRGGWLAVEITWHGPAVRIAVADCGAPDGPQLIDDPMGEHGRGLQMVRALSVRFGVSGDQRGRLVWAEVLWAGPGAGAPTGFGDDYESAIRDDEAALARRYADVPTWFGRSTLQWWALPGPGGGLLTAPSSGELADLLDRALRALRARYWGPGRPGARRPDWRAKGACVPALPGSNT